MKIAKSLKDLERQIKEDLQKAVVDTLLQEVSELAKDVILHHVQTDVYDVYEPEYYERRGPDRGKGRGQGLGDRNNLVERIDDNNALVISEVAVYNPYRNYAPIYPHPGSDNPNLVKLIVDGYAGHGDDSAPYAKPRPFMENAGDALKAGGINHKDLDEAFETGLKRHGIKKKK